MTLSGHVARRFKPYPLPGRNDVSGNTDFAVTTNGYLIRAKLPSRFAACAATSALGI